MLIPIQGTRFLQTRKDGVKKIEALCITPLFLTAGPFVLLLILLLIILLILLLTDANDL